MLVITQLLMGEIPERSLFRQADVKRSLVPYLALTEVPGKTRRALLRFLIPGLEQAVRVGDLSAFASVMAKYGAIFKSDKTFTLINRYVALSLQEEIGIF